MPAPTAPTLYQSVTPLTAFEDAAEQLQRIQQETAKIQGQRYQEVGTPAKLGALQAGRRTLEAASYLSSVPQGDRYLEATTGVSKPFEPLREAAKENLSEAQKEYAKALAKVGEVPQPTISETPSWAKRTVT
jgi:hypothetical protein